MNDLAKRFKETLLDELTPVAVKHAWIGVPLSGGMDSTAVMLAIRELGSGVVAASFRMQGKESTDWRIAKTNAARIGSKFIDVELPDDVETLKNDTFTLIKGMGLSKKAEVECVWPFLYVYPKLGMSVATAVTGAGGDGHHGVSKKAMIHFKATVELMDQFRTAYFEKKNPVQMDTLSDLAKSLGMDLHHPLASRPIRDLFMGWSWDELNKPRQKETFRQAFEDELKNLVKIPPHSNLQCGDSGVREHFDKLLKTDWNIGGWTNVVGIFNAVREGRVS